jgi:hypothetical protein
VAKLNVFLDLPILLKRRIPMKVNQSNFLNQYMADSLKAESAKGKNADSINQNDPTKTNTEEESYMVELSAGNMKLEVDAKDIVAYGNPNITLDSAVMNQLLQESDDIGSTVSQMVGDLLQRQGITIDQLKSGETENIGVDELARQKAAEMIGPGGEFSPEKVSDRIVNFSIAAMGGDKSKIEDIRSAIDRGFDEAEQMLGGLADVSKQTYELIQDKLDNWVNGETAETTES